MHPVAFDYNFQGRRVLRDIGELKRDIFGRGGLDDVSCGKLEEVRVALEGRRVEISRSRGENGILRTLCTFQRFRHATPTRCLGRRT